jgi:hypothetical protein
MLCNRCGNELPSDTPVCPQCGPVSFGAGYAPPPAAPLPPLPSIEVTPVPVTPPPLAMPALPGIAVDVPATPVAPPAPPAPSKADRNRERKQRIREALAARARETAPTLTDAAEGGTAEAAIEAIDEVPLAAFERPTAVTQMAAVDGAVGGAKLLVATAMLGGQITGGTEEGLRVGVGALVLLTAAVGLWTLRPFGRYAQFAMAALLLISGVLTFFLAIPFFAYLARPGVALLFSGRAPAALSGASRARIRRDGESPRMIPIALGIYALLALITLWSPLASLVSR